MKMNPSCETCAPSPIQVRSLDVNMQSVLLNNFKGGQGCGACGGALVRSDRSLRPLRYRLCSPRQEVTIFCSTAKESRIKLESSKLRS